MANTTLTLDDRLLDYLRAVSLRESALLAELRAETAGMRGAVMQIAPEQGQFMHLLARIAGARNALEVGVYTGYSGLSVASALPADGYLLGLDINPDTSAIARRYWDRAALAARTEIRVGPALDALDALLAEGLRGHFDFSFIDADKTHYAAYFEKVLALSRPGALILIDNVLWSGKVADDSIDDADTVALRAFNAALHADARIDIALLPIADGLTLARKR